ncbi:putative oxidoreductase [Gordonia araii NBRC 100433]|uniref:Putative oxidoreductase n=1 Tax=Gordonia araii NBRC 100433 TaxID=1073574 RepID=G7H6U3_9ACTN|nr:FAD-dependent monooxygenase [Gordonia araii]NNG95986.1 oxidoreductase [Gordonia araii NBRC 100433]GAB11568.1 putative oxidoreductase [Gordonia araii NBRC 100433]
MKLNSIAVLGGGPGGLYAARLLKLSHPDARVTVYEQGMPDKTFGFGVGLASRTQRNLRLADESSLDAIVAASHPHEMAMRVGDAEVRLAHGELLAIGRATLLSVLQDCAREVGVELRFGERREAADLDADLIVAADGINSATREARPDEFGPTITWGEGLYLWCGTDFALPSAVFAPVTTEHGTFVAHAYPYSEDRSTFLVETDEQTWKRAGFDVSTDETPPNDSDRVSLDYLAEAFAQTLQGHKLIGNRTRWMRFRTVRCAAWHAGNTVLLGDAAHTAHYSIGSGTKLAMEDAIALDRALLAHDDLASAFTAYEEDRRPAVAHLQAIAERSMAWWDRFPERTDMPVEQLMLAYMTRAGKVSLSKFAESAPAVAKSGLAAFAGCDLGDIPGSEAITDWVLSLPGDGAADRIAPAELRDAATTTAVEIADRPWSDATDRLLAELPDAAVYWLTGPADRESTLDRLDVAERIRRSGGARVVVEMPGRYRDDAAAAVASERVDLVSLVD